MPLPSAVPPRRPDAADAADAADAEHSQQRTAPALTREIVREILAEIAYAALPRDRDWISSIEVAWLVAAVELRYRTRLTLTDEQAADLRTVDDVVRILGAALGAGGDGRAEESAEG